MIGASKDHESTNQQQTRESKTKRGEIPNWHATPEQFIRNHYQYMNNEKRKEIENFRKDAGIFKANGKHKVAIKALLRARELLCSEELGGELDVEIGKCYNEMGLVTL